MDNAYRKSELERNLDIKIHLISFQRREPGWSHEWLGTLSKLRLVSNGDVVSLPLFRATKSE